MKKFNIDSFVRNSNPILVEYKNEKTEYDYRLSPTSNWGNPWDFSLKNEGFEVSSEEEAIDNFKKWLWGEKFIDLLQKKRRWILLNLKFLKGRRIAYFNRKYAEVLIDAIDKNIEIPNIEIEIELVPKKTIKKIKKTKSIF